jgi:outer membrane lipoprotein LolB
MPNLLRLAAMLCAAALAACTTLATIPPDAAPAPGFELAGRMVVRYQDRAFSSAVRWKQMPGSDEIWFTAPLGQTLAHLQSDGNGAILTTADQQQYRATSIESLTRSALGWRFPVAGLRYWVLGLPAPQLPQAAVERDAAGRVVSLQQGDLRVAFAYAGADSTRPSRVEVAGADAQLRLVTDDLTLTQP